MIKRWLIRRLIKSVQIEVDAPDVYGFSIKGLEDLDGRISITFTGNLTIKDPSIFKDMRTNVIMNGMGCKDV